MHILVVDDHPILRLGVRQLLLGAWPDAQVNEAQNVQEAQARLQAQPVSLIVLDLSLPDASGTEAPAQLLRVAGATPILVLSLSAEATYAARLLQMGVAGYLPKERAGEELVRAARQVLQGQRYVTEEMAQRLLEQPATRAAGALPHELLSAQEMRVTQLIAAGRSPAQIAQLMGISVKTVGSYRARILAKAGWANNTELTKYCVQHGLTAPN